MLGQLFANRQRKRQKAIAAELCDAIFERAHRPEPYLAGWAVDDLDGRFEWSALHGGLVLARLGGAGKAGRELASLVVDDLFGRYDYSLRETGVGDTVIAKKVRALGERFYGLASAVQAGLDEAGGVQALSDALKRNGIAPGCEAETAAYLVRCKAALDLLSDVNICSGELTWPGFAIDRSDNPI